MSVRFSHPSNAPRSMLVTLFGMVTFARFEQSLKVSTPIHVIPSESVALVNSRQCSNGPQPLELVKSSFVSAPIRFTPPGTVTLVNLLLKNAPAPINVTLLGIEILVRLLQYENAPFPIEVTLSGIETSVKPIHKVNALAPIEVTPSGIRMLAKLLQSQKAPTPIEVTLLGIKILVRLTH